MERNTEWSKQNFLLHHPVTTKAFDVEYLKAEKKIFLSAHFYGFCALFQSSIDSINFNQKQTHEWGIFALCSTLGNWIEWLPCHAIHKISSSWTIKKFSRTHRLPLCFLFACKASSHKIIITRSINELLLMPVASFNVFNSSLTPKH